MTVGPVNSPAGIAIGPRTFLLALSARFCTSPSLSYPPLHHHPPARFDRVRECFGSFSVPFSPFLRLLWRVMVLVGVQTVLAASSRMKEVIGCRQGGWGGDEWFFLR